MLRWYPTCITPFPYYSSSPKPASLGGGKNFWKNVIVYHRRKWQIKLSSYPHLCLLYFSYRRREQVHYLASFLDFNNVVGLERGSKREDTYLARAWKLGLNPSILPSPLALPGVVHKHRYRSNLWGPLVMAPKQKENWSRDNTWGANARLNIGTKGNTELAQQTECLSCLQLIQVQSPALYILPGVPLGVFVEHRARSNPRVPQNKTKKHWKGQESYYSR